MVKTIHVTMDDDVYAKINAVKAELDVTWEEFMKRGAECLDQGD